MAVLLPNRSAGLSMADAVGSAIADRAVAGFRSLLFALSAAWRSRSASRLDDGQGPCRRQVVDFACHDSHPAAP